MKLISWIVAAVAGGALLAGVAPAQTESSGVDKLYIFDCGHGVGPDQARWSPGVNVGKPLEISDSCYLIHHAQGYLLWDTGIPDALAATPEGQPASGSAPAWRRPKTLGGAARRDRRQALRHPLRRDLAHPSGSCRQCRAVPDRDGAHPEGGVRLGLRLAEAAFCPETAVLAGSPGHEARRR